MSDQYLQHPQYHVVDVAAGATLLGTFFGYLPVTLSVIGSVLAIAWYVHLFYTAYFKKK